LGFVILWSNIAIRPVYTVSMVVRQMQSQQQGGLASMLVGTGVSSLLGGQNSMAMSSYIELLQSNTVATALMSDKKMMEALFGGAVDSKTGKWRSTKGRIVKNAVMSLFGLSPLDRPTVDDVQSMLNTALQVNQDLKSNLTLISCTSSDPERCRNLILAVHRAAEARLNDIALQQAIAIRGYISRELPNISVVEVQSALIDLQASSEKQIVLSNANQPVAAEILDLPIVPLQPSSPRPAIMILIALAFGLTLGGWASWHFDDRQVLVTVRKIIGQRFHITRETSA
jgi:uncharacterized protein involved in exopolysaccharide biosynthesis